MFFIFFNSYTFIIFCKINSFIMFLTLISRGVELLSQLQPNPRRFGFYLFFFPSATLFLFVCLFAFYYFFCSIRLFVYFFFKKKKKKKVIFFLVSYPIFYILFLSFFLLSLFFLRYFGEGIRVGQAGEAPLNRIFCVTYVVAEGEDLDLEAYRTVVKRLRLVR